MPTEMSGSACGPQPSIEPPSKLWSSQVAPGNENGLRVIADELTPKYRVPIVQFTYWYAAAEPIAPVAAAPTAAPTAAAPLSFDLAGVSLDLDPPSDAAGDTTSAGELTEENPLETKLSLAEEFRAIGDIEGARSLAEEVMNESSGTLQSKARTFLADLA